MDTFINSYMTFSISFQGLAEDADWNPWLGLFKTNDSDWSWKDNSPLHFKKWYPGDPYGDYDDCVYVSIP